jgi:hypothetical protein
MLQVACEPGAQAMNTTLLDQVAERRDITHAPIMADVDIADGGR